MRFQLLSVDLPFEVLEDDDLVDALGIVVLLTQRMVVACSLTAGQQQPLTTKLIQDKSPAFTQLVLVYWCIRCLPLIR